MLVCVNDSQHLTKTILTGYKDLLRKEAKQSGSADETKATEAKAAKTNSRKRQRASMDSPAADATSSAEAKEDGKGEDTDEEPAKKKGKKSAKKAAQRG